MLLCAIGFATVIFFIGYAFLIILGVWWILDAYFTYKIVTDENVKMGIENSSISLTKSGGVYNELDQLEKLHSLYEKGVITKEQYEAKKTACYKHNKNIKSCPAGSDHRCAPALYVGRYKPELPTII